ncbi:V/A-type H+-transporting ATPase subunit I [Anaerosphaera aminiphila DSM 21120]|uniref:V/A-type H+-transporting ATPase subunit I n=1 Tax=Anaerosphaera aminiphila DSM 21120 TaxID=1120995 RepID=A0A1M5UAU4_9FIRM|nr:V-type ATP synthase subunit I [Anaerosphaera aminiphila]SHH59966.1 V/A-type H+-transporting ATPase subunit I [Anaerosphaera aminiphila DSM 21120]
MAIVKMSKFNLFSFDSDRKNLLKSLQKFNDVHFNRLESEEDNYLTEINVSDALMELDNEITKAKWSIDLLSKFSEKKKGLDALKEGNKNLTLEELIKRAKSFDFNTNYEKLHNLADEKSTMEQRILSLESNISTLSPWQSIGVPIEELKSFGNVVVRIGTISAKYEEKLISEIKSFEFTSVEKVSSDKNFLYLVIYNDISEDEEIYEFLKESGFTSVEIKTKGILSENIKSMEGEISELKVKIIEIEEEIKSYRELLEDFQVYYEYLRNSKVRIESSENFIKTKSVDIIEGYVPTSDSDELIKLLDSVLKDNYYIQIEDADKDDPKVPIKLKNNKFVTAFESITAMYAMPKYNEIDPTPLFAPFYFVFAGIMVGDIGFGLLMVLGASIALKFFNLNKAMKGMVTFFRYLGVSTVMWGFVFGSFFGDLLPLKAIIDPAVDYMEMIMMSLIFGGIHIFFSLGIKGYMDIRDKKPFDALFDVGFWYMALVGVIVALISYLMNINPMIFKMAIIVMALGMIGIVLTGGRHEKSIAAKIGWGIYSLYGITSYLSDFVSYLRLMALALAGSFISVAINIIVRMLVGKGIFGIVAGVLIFVGFQLFNMFLSFLSAYVHTARLTYVEMFNKFYEGGGIPFKNMIAKSKYFNIEEE